MCELRKWELARARERAADAAVAPALAAAVLALLDGLEWAVEWPEADARLVDAAALLPDDE